MTPRQRQAVRLAVFPGYRLPNSAMAERFAVADRITEAVLAQLPRSNPHTEHLDNRRKGGSTNV